MCGTYNVISCGAATSIFALLGLNRDCLSRADGFAELAGDAAFLSSGVATKHEFAAKSWADGTLFERVVDGVGRAEELLQDDVHAAHHFRHEKITAGMVHERRLGLVPAGRRGQTEAGRRFASGRGIACGRRRKGASLDAEGGRGGAQPD